MSKETILIVEDEAIVAADLANKLRQLGYGICGTAARGQEALAFARERGPDLVLMDIRLAGPMDGVEAAAAIHRECGLPVIFLTAHSDRATLQRAKVTEAFGYILKPFETRELETQIEIALYKHQTERKLRESETRFRAAFEHGAIPMTLTSLDHTLLKVNSAFCRMLGFCEAELLGRGFAEITHPDDLALNIKGVREVCAGQAPAFRMEKRYIGKSGNVIWGDISTAPVCDALGVPLYTVTHVQDITERKQAEQALRQAQAQLKAYAEDLEITVASRTAKLRETIAELEHFSYAIVHDMRAPLRAMQGFADLLEKDCGACERPLGKEFFRRIKIASDRMDQLITDSLSYSKAVRQELTLESVGLFRLLDGMVETYPNLFPDKADIQIARGLPSVLGNPAALTQCFGNLLDNAVKFAKPGTKPQIRIRAEDSPRSSISPSNPSPGQLVRIWVEDNGIGIPKLAQRRIFALFQRADTSREGTGIGLAIVRKMAQRMGGGVGVESEEGQGSRFWVDLLRAP